MTLYPPYRDHGDRDRQYLLDVASAAERPSPSGVTPSSWVLCGDSQLVVDLCRDYLALDAEHRAALERLEDRAVQQGLDSACVVITGRSCEAVTRDLRAPSPEDIDARRDPRDHLCDFPYADASTTELRAYLDAQRVIAVREPNTFARQTAALIVAQVEREIAIRNRRAYDALVAEDRVRIAKLEAALRDAGVRDPTCPIDHLGPCTHACTINPLTEAAS